MYHGIGYFSEYSPHPKAGRKSVPPKMQLPDIHEKRHFKAIRTVGMKQKCKEVGPRLVVRRKGCAEGELNGRTANHDEFPENAELNQRRAWLSLHDRPQHQGLLQAGLGCDEELQAPARQALRDNDA